MTREQELEDVFGPLAEHREHSPGDQVRYRLPGEEAILTGRVIWCTVLAPYGLRYWVERDGAGNSFPDVAFPALIIEAL